MLGGGFSIIIVSCYNLSLIQNDLAPGPSLSSSRGWPGLAVLGEHLYCVGGYDGRDRAVATVERIHLRGDRWEPVADMNKVSGERKLLYRRGANY